MSGSQHRPPGPHRSGRRAGPDSANRHGFSRIPEPARSAVIAAMEEEEIGAVFDLCAGLRFELAEIVRMEERGGRWVLNDEAVPIPEETSERVRALKKMLAAKAGERGRKAGELLSDLLKRVTRKVRQELEGQYPWARNVVVSAGTLHQIADEAAGALFGDDPARLRTYRRSPYARAATVRPATTAMVADAYDAVMRPLLVDVLSRCTPRALEAIESLKELSQ